MHLRADNLGKIADVQNIFMTVWVKQQGKWRESAWIAVGAPKEQSRRFRKQIAAFASLEIVGRPGAESPGLPPTTYAPQSVLFLRLRDRDEARVAGHAVAHIRRVTFGTAPPARICDKGSASETERRKRRW